MIGAILERSFERSNFRSIFGSILVAKREPKGSRRHPGESWRGPGGVLGGSWAVLGRSWSDLLNSPTSNRFLDRFWSPKGCPQGGFMGAKTGPKSTLRRGRNLRVKKLRLGSDLGRFWFVFGGCRGGIFVDFVSGFVLFCGHRRFRC